MISLLVVGQDMKVSVALSKNVIICFVSVPIYIWTANPPLFRSHCLQVVH